MSSAFHSEVLAIQKLRAKYPDIGQSTLARKIKNSTFETEADNVLALNAGSVGRPLLSIYSVIRRYDAKQRQLQTA